MRKLNEGWRGLNTVKLIDNGAYSDPELQYIDEHGNKYIANYWDIEDGMYQYYKEEKDYVEKNDDKYANNLKNTFKFDGSDEDFAKFLKAHEVEVIQDIIDASKSPEITEDLSKYTDDELETELKNRKNNNARLVYLNEDEIIFDPNNEYIVNKFKEGDVLELLDDVLYADLNTSKDIVFDDSNYDDEKAIELLDTKYGLKVTNDENNEVMTYFPKGTQLIIDELNGPAGWTTFKVEGKEALDFSEPIKFKYRGNKYGKYHGWKSTF